MALRSLKDTGEEYTIASNIDGAVYSLISEDCVIGGMGDEFKLNYVADSLDVNFTKGSIALIDGNAFWITDTEVITLPSNSTAFLVARIDTSKPNGQTASFEFITQSAIQKGNINEGGIRDLLLYTITTTSNGIKTVVDNRKIISSNSNTITSVLKAGQTSLTINDARITDGVILAFDSQVYGVNPLSAKADEGYVTLTFDAQTSDIVFCVEIVGKY